MAKKGKKACAPKKKAHGYKMPPPIPPGEIIHDRDRRWMIGPSIGVGGFGEIYSACEYREGESPPSDVSHYPYVIKIEPMENGPLFVETHFYNRNYDKNDIQQFMESRNLSQLGMPTYCGSGSHMFQNEEFRFLILERYGTDLWKTFKQVGQKFPTPTVFQLGLQMLDVLDYIHSRSYIHADIKGANILMGIKEGTENQAYLVDFGLAYKIVEDNYLPDPKSAHEGTIEYTSTDRHKGAKTMRGDLEILGYNLLQWLVGELPWEQVLENPKKVHKIKTDFMNNVRSRITADYPKVPDELIKFFEYIKTLEPQDNPDYTVCCKIFESYLTSVGKTRSSQLEFTTTNDNDLPLSPNGDSSKETERAEIESVIRLENSQEQDATNKKRKSSEELKMPTAKRSKKIISTKPLEDIPLTESDSEIELNKIQDQIVPKIKKNKNKRDENTVDSPPVENYAVSEQPNDKQEPKVTKSKKDKRKKDEMPDDLTENYAENELPHDNQQPKVTKTKKDNKKKGNPENIPAENHAESEQPDDSQEQKVTKSKKDKKKKDVNSDVLAENNAEKELPDDSQKPKVTKSKNDKQNKDKNPDDILPAESGVERKQPDDNQEQKVTKPKKDKKKKDEYPDDLREYDTENDQPDNNQEQKVTKSRKDKKRKVENPDDIAESYAENVLPDDNKEQKVTKSKKNKKQKVEIPDLADNDAENELSDDNNQEQKVTKSKKDKKKKVENLDDLTENYAENELPENNQEQKVTKTKKNKKKKAENPVDTPAAENNAESEQPDDNQAQEITKTKKNKSKKDKKTKVANDAECESPDDNVEEPAKKKRRTSELTTPKKKSDKKPKSKYYQQESNSESENKLAVFKDKKMKEKKTKSDFVSPLFKRVLPVIKVNAASSRSLRSSGKKTRSCFTNL